MKQSDKFYNIAIGVVIAAIIVILIFKFVVPGKPRLGIFSIDQYEAVTLFDLGGNEHRLAELMESEDDAYCFFFEITNCYSCVSKGIEDLKRLKAAGKHCIGIAVHHMVDEIAGWSANYDFTPFYMMKQEDFYQHIHTPSMPVMVKMKSGKIVNFRYILP